MQPFFRENEAKSLVRNLEKGIGKLMMKGRKNKHSYEIIM